MHVTDRVQQLFRPGLFKHVAGCARGERVKNVLGILVNRQHDDLGAREQGFEAAGAFDSVDAGQIDVHQNDVGPDLGNLLERIFGAGVFTDTLVAI